MTETQRATDTQVGGDHYRSMAIQPSEFIQRNGLNWCEGNVIKYLARHRNKNGAQDIQKAIHYCQLLLEWEYPGHGKTAADYTPLSPSEVKEIAESVAPVMACDNCLRENCGLDPLGPVPVCGHHLPPAGEMPLWPKASPPAAVPCGWSYQGSCTFTTECEQEYVYEEPMPEVCPACGRRIAIVDLPSPPPSDEWETKDLCRVCVNDECSAAGTKHERECCESYSEMKAPAPLSLSLPSITVEGDLEEVRKKYREEWNEWRNSSPESIAEIIEAFDVIQVRQTLVERGGSLVGLPDAAESWLEARYKETPEIIEAAKRAMIIKNAARAMYAPEVCEKIIMSGGHSW